MPEELRSMTFSVDEVMDILADFAGYSKQHSELKFSLEDGGVVSACLSSTKVVRQQQRVRSVEEDCLKVMGKDLHEAEKVKPLTDVVLDEEKEEDVPLPKNFVSAVCPACGNTVELDLPVNAKASYVVWCPHKECGEKLTLRDFQIATQRSGSGKGQKKASLPLKKGKTRQEMLEEEAFQRQMQELGLE